MCMDVIILTQSCMTQYHSMGINACAITHGDVFADVGPGSDDNILANNGSWMNKSSRGDTGKSGRSGARVHVYSLMFINSTVQANSPLTVASPLNFQSFSR